MFGKKREPDPLHLDLPRPVWFLLVEVEITGDSLQPWIAGSKALVQAFVPEHRLEDSLVALDEYLPTQELKRIDTQRAVRHHADEEWDELPNDYYREPLEEAARMNKCTLGIFIVSQDSAWPHGEQS